MKRMAFRLQKIFFSVFILNKLFFKIATPQTAEGAAMGSSGHDTNPSGSVKRRDIFYHLSDYQFLKKASGA
jgi:hypothetical protein